MAKFMLYGLKSKLGLVPDLSGMKETTANTSLQFHAGDHDAADVEECCCTIVVVIVAVLLLF